MDSATAPIQYHIPIPVYLELGLALLFGRRIPFRRHAGMMLRTIQHSFTLLGDEHVPRAGPALITVNHYAAPGFWAPWLAAAISTVTPVEVFWTMAAALSFSGWLGPFLNRGSRVLLRQVARVYGFNVMPPMPPTTGEAAERAASVRRLFQHAANNPQAVIGLAPEGGDYPGGVLHMPPPGAGRLLLALSGKGMVFHPAAVYEERGRLVLRFGPPYRLEVPAISPRDALDGLVSCRVMTAIAECLPERLRGEFARER